MPNERPPSLDPIAARRWAHLPWDGINKAESVDSPWLHEEVARRMAERLPYIRLQPKSWAFWNPVRAGLNALALLQKTLTMYKILLTQSIMVLVTWLLALLLPSYVLLPLNL
jgi:malonyl-CoA O-methyltransferase